jgi:hypothetical protein
MVWVDSAGESPTGRFLQGALMIDFFNLTAQRIYGKPDGWQWCRLDAHNKPDDYIEVKGEVPIGVIRSGKRKGSPKWPKTLHVVWMRMSEIESVKMQWEQETGKCSKCYGEGHESYGWSRDSGQMLRKCRRCEGTGKMPQ